jgi:thiol-disulfide isomerase/thioredoxin
MKSTLQTIAILFLLFLWGLISAYSKAGPNESYQLPNLVFAQKPYEIPEWNQPKKKVVYFWATWCGVCKTSRPVVDWNHRIADLLGIDFYTVEEGGDLPNLQKYLQNSSFEYPVLEGNEEILKTLEIRAYPSYIFFNEKSEKVFHDVGVLTPIGFIFRLLIL